MIFYDVRARIIRQQNYFYDVRARIIKQQNYFYDVREKKATKPQQKNVHKMVLD